LFHADEVMSCSEDSDLDITGWHRPSHT